MVTNALMIIFHLSGYSMLLIAVGAFLTGSIVLPFLAKSSPKPREQVINDFLRTWKCFWSASILGGWLLFFGVRLAAENSPPPNDVEQSEVSE